VYSICDGCGRRWRVYSDDDDDASLVVFERGCVQCELLLLLRCNETVS